LRAPHQSDGTGTRLCGWDGRLGWPGAWLYRSRRGPRDAEVKGRTLAVSIAWEPHLCCHPTLAS